MQIHDENDRKKLGLVGMMFTWSALIIGHRANFGHWTIYATFLDQSLGGEASEITRPFLLSSCVISCYLSSQLESGLFAMFQVLKPCILMLSSHTVTNGVIYTVMSHASMMMWLRRYARCSTTRIETGCNVIFGLLIIAIFMDENENDCSIAGICMFCYTMFSGTITSIQSEIYTEDVEYLQLEDYEFAEKNRDM